jgi:dihydrofolate synthase/folylpolyglutamate synthase
LKIATTLQQHGLKVGLFCSPHVSSFRERMQVNGQVISEEEVVEVLPQIYDMCATHDIPATFFEITTALAFWFYAKKDVQVVVLETGLGGRLDATNVISRPALSVITSIGLEHTRILGDTMELIAKEKGGIIKPGRPVLVGPHCPQNVLQQVTREAGAGPYYVPQEVLGDTKDMEITDYDEENQRIAKAALTLLKQSYPELLQDLTEESMDQGTVIRPPCRFEIVQAQDNGFAVILDVAHNPQAMEYLVRKLQATYPDASFRFVAGMSSDKDLGQCGRTILEATDPTSVHLVEAAHPRAATLEAILASEPALASCNYDLADRSITKQVLGAMTLAKERGEILVVCGSVFLMAEAREALGFDEPRDSDYISEMAGAGVRHGQENFGNTTMEDENKRS